MRLLALRSQEMCMLSNPEAQACKPRAPGAPGIQVAPKAKTKSTYIGLKPITWQERPCTAHAHAPDNGRRTAPAQWANGPGCSCPLHAAQRCAVALAPRATTAHVTHPRGGQRVSRLRHRRLPAAPQDASSLSGRWRGAHSPVWPHQRPGIHRRLSGLTSARARAPLVLAAGQRRPD